MTAVRTRTLRLWIHRSGFQIDWY